MNSATAKRWIKDAVAQALHAQQELDASRGYTMDSGAAAVYKELQKELEDGSIWIVSAEELRDQLIETFQHDES